MLAHRRALAAVFVLVALAGCGGDDADPPEDVRGTEPGRPAEWDAASVPLARGADTELLTAVDGDTIVLLTADDEGVVSSAVATGDGAFATGPPLETGAGYLRLGGLVRFDGAWWAAGPGGTRAVPSRPDDWETTFDLHLVRSTDGLTWTEVATTGLEGPAEITGLVATDDGLVAVGHDQSGNLDGGDMEAGFAPRAWRSADGTSWAAVPLAADDAEWGPSALLATDDGLLAVGGADDGTGAWRSGDAGRSWAEVELDGLGTARLREVVPLGDALLAAGAGEGGEDAPDGTPYVAAPPTAAGRGRRSTSPRPRAPRPSGCRSSSPATGSSPSSRSSSSRGRTRPPATPTSPSARATAPPSSTRATARGRGHGSTWPASTSTSTRTSTA